MGGHARRDLRTARGVRVVRDFTVGRPDFWFSARNGLIDALLQKTARLAVRRHGRALRVLVVGPGTGDEIYLARQYGSVTVLDTSEQVLESIPDDLVALKVCGDVQHQHNFRMEEGMKFDVVMAFDVLEHVKNDSVAAINIHSWLKEGGSFIGSVPACPSLFGSHDRYWGHHRRYERKDVEELLSHFGRVKVGYWNSLLFFPFAALRLLQKKGSGAHDNDPPFIIGFVLRAIMGFENMLLRHGHSFKRGLTVIFHATKVK